MTLRDIALALGFEVDESSASAAENRITDIKNMATKLLGAIGIGFSLVQLNEIAEEFAGINEEILNATSALGDQADIQQDILDTANEIRMSYSDTASMISTLVQNDTNLFGSVDEASEFVELSTKLFKTANKSNEEIVSLQESINKSFAKGAVESETITQLLENAPEAANLLADSLGVTKDALTDMATAGTISLADLKSAFVDNADAINAGYANVKYNVTDALTNIRNQWGIFIAGVNEDFAVTESIGTAMVAVATKGIELLKQAQTQVERLATRVGGINNLLKLVAILAAAIVIALNMATIISYAKKAITFLKSASTLMSGIGLKVFALVAVLVILFLIIDDFIHFMKGEDSVLGEILERSGIDADAIRAKIIETWETIKDYLAKAWQTIKAIALAVWNSLQEFWKENGDEILASLKAVWEGLKIALTAIWNGLKTAAVTIFNALKAFWDEWGDEIMTAFGILWDTLVGLIMPFFDILAALGEFIGNVFTGNWTAAWENIKNILITIWDAIVSIISGVLEIIWTFIGEKVTAIKDSIIGAFTTVRDTLTGIFDAIKTTISGAFDALVGLIKTPINAIIDLINGLIDGLNGLSIDIPDWVPGIGGGTLGFSIPNLPRLAQGGYVKANSPQLAVVGDNTTQGEIIAPEGKILSVVLSALEIFAAKFMPSQSLDTMAAASYVWNIVQNINISNTFQGGTADAQKSGAKAMTKAGEDVTGELARAIAYGR